MRKISWMLALMLAVTTFSPVQAAVSIVNDHTSMQAAPQTYTVLVGGEDTSTGADFEAYLPANLRIHVGDTVIWKVNTAEIHTVTFLGNMTAIPPFVIPVPGGGPADLMVNPQAGFPAMPAGGKFDGSGYVNSGIISPQQGQVQEFQLTFTNAGTYKYVCIVHNVEDMVGSVTVVDQNTAVPSPSDATVQGQKELGVLMAKAPALIQAALAEVPRDEDNADGTTTHHVLVGYSKGQIDLESYFPRDLTVNDGDTVVWSFANQDVAPHTVTFLNGTDDPSLIIPKPQPGGPPLLLLNQNVIMPQNADKPLSSMGYYNSGLMDPSLPGPHTFSLKIGDILGTFHYQCILHDDNGMKGTITVPFTIDS